MEIYSSYCYPYIDRETIIAKNDENMTNIIMSFIMVFSLDGFPATINLTKVIGALGSFSAVMIPFGKTIVGLIFSSLCSVNLFTLAKKKNEFKIKYYTYCYNSYLKTGCNNMNLEYCFFNNSEITQKQYKTLLFNSLNNNPPQIFHIHDFELLPVAYKLKKKHKHVKIIYDVHEDKISMWDTFSSHSGIMKKFINKLI